MEKLQLQLNDKIAEYDELASHLDRKMPDPYREYEDLQLGHESLKPIMIKPDIEGVDYHALVDAEIRVGLEGILESIRNFLAKILRWIRDKLLALYSWIINANDEILLEIEKIKKNTPSELHNKLVNTVNRINELSGEFDDDFSVVVSGYGIYTELKLYKIEEVNKLLPASNYALPDPKFIKSIAEVRDDFISDLSEFIDSLPSGPVAIGKYYDLQLSQLQKHGGFKKGNLKSIDLSIDSDFGREAEINTVRTLETFVAPKLRVNNKMLRVNINNKCKHIKIKRPKIKDIEELTLGDMFETIDYSEVLDFPKADKIKDVDMLSIKVTEQDIDPNQMSKTKDLETITIEARLAVNRLHSKLIADLVTDFSTVITIIDEVVKENVMFLKDVSSNNAKIASVLYKKYEKSVEAAEKILVELERNKG